MVLAALKSSLSLVGFSLKGKIIQSESGRDNQKSGKNLDAVKNALKNNSVLVGVRNAGNILKLIDALFVAFELADHGCLEIHGVAFCLGAGGENLALELLFRRMQFIVKGTALVMKRADICPLCVLLLQDRAGYIGNAGEQFAPAVLCFLKGFLSLLHSFDRSV
jgi:hypothetical protein